jgi:hypothetical protein
MGDFVAPHADPRRVRPRLANRDTATCVRRNADGATRTPALDSRDMFGTLLGGLPIPPFADDAATLLEAGVRAQETAGFEPITDGRLGERPFESPSRESPPLPSPSPFDLGALAWGRWTSPVSVAGWQATAELTERAVKQSLPGPYTLARRLRGSGRARERAALAAAEGLRQEALALAAAGCPLVEIEESEAHRIGDEESERRIFVAAHRRLAEALTGTHLSLSIVGGSAWDAGAATILDAPYQSLAVDLIAGPDNWNLVVRAPADRGIVAGALSPQLGSDDAPELLLWAANYAASSGGRGLARVGLAIAGSLAPLTWEQAVTKLERLAKGVRLASLPPGDELAASVDPRSINIRSAAYGRPMPNRSPGPAGSAPSGRAGSAQPGRRRPRRTIPKSDTGSDAGSEGAR